MARKAPLHLQGYTSGPWGGVQNRTLCGRRTGDGDNVSDTGIEGVTCKLCLRIINTYPKRLARFLEDDRKALETMDRVEPVDGGAA